uniref:Uncharacterized protein n=1 Tax=viral metagenome TaxID=1070528 RepID=A0A6C0H7W3_9ZZZZ
MKNISQTPILYIQDIKNTLIFFLSWIIICSYSIIVILLLIFNYISKNSYINKILLFYIIYTSIFISIMYNIYKYLYEK